MKKTNKSTLYIIRHGRSESNYARTKFGPRAASLIRDPLLYNKDDDGENLNGVKQAKKLDSLPWDKMIDSAYVSPLRRTVQTANLVLNKYPQIPITIKRLLRERSWRSNENHGLQLGYKHILDSLHFKNNSSSILGLEKLNRKSWVWNPVDKEHNLYLEKANKRLWETLNKKLKNRINCKNGIAIFTHWGIVNFIKDKILEKKPFYNFKFKNKNCCVIKLDFIYDQKGNHIDYEITLINKDKRCIN